MLQTKSVPQRLKPYCLMILRARLKPCPKQTGFHHPLKLDLSQKQRSRKQQRQEQRQERERVYIPHLRIEMLGTSRVCGGLGENRQQQQQMQRQEQRHEAGPPPSAKDDNVMRALKLRAALGTLEINVGGTRVYSWRRATTGSMRAALMAGSRPEMIPTAARITNETIMMVGEARRMMSPWWLAVL